MSTSPRTFTLGPPLLINKYDPVRRTVREGYEYPVHDAETGANISVFVPSDVHTPEGTEQLVEHALAPIRANLAANPQS